jgi:creatinine amidohydrolase
MEWPFCSRDGPGSNAVRRSNGTTEKEKKQKMTAQVAMGEMSWVEYSKRIAVPGTISILPVGSTEQHGPHMSMNTDVLLPTEIALEVARRINGIVSPTLNYGYKSIQRSGGGNHFCGTTSLDGNTLSCMVRDILRELARHGARHVVLLNGHFENVYFLLEGADLAIRELKASNIDRFEVLTLTYRDFIESNTLSKVFPDGFEGWALEHAGVMETSLMLHLFPQFVDMSLAPAEVHAKFPPYDVLPSVPGLTPPAGCLASPAKASAAKGQLMFETVVSGIVDALQKEKRRR